MATFRYWRIHITAVGGTAGGLGALAAIAEITMRSVIGGSNVATGGTASASSSFSGSFLPANAFDGSTSSAWISAGSAGMPQWIQYDFGSGVEIQQVDILPRDTDMERDVPIAFTVQGSNDNSTFTTVATYSTPAIDWTVGITRSFFMPGYPDTAEAAYRYWRLRSWTVEGGSVVVGGLVAIAELQLRETVGGANVATGGTASASSSFNSSFLPANAFDGNAATQWASAAGMPQSLIYDLGAGNAKAIRQYVVTPRNDDSFDDQSPLAWTLEGSNDASTWVVRDARNSGMADWAMGVARTFAVTSGVPSATARRRFAGAIG